MEALLFLAHRLPYPPNKGDKIRSFHFLRHLAGRYRVYLGTFVDDPMFGRILRPGQLDADQRLQPGETLQLQVGQPIGLPRSATSVLLNITGTGATAPTFVTAWAAGAVQPYASSLNLLPGATRPNLVLAEVGDDGFVSLFNGAGEVHLVADVVGYFATQGSPSAGW